MYVTSSLCTLSTLLFTCLDAKTIKPGHHHNSAKVSGRVANAHATPTNNIAFSLPTSVPGDASQQLASTPVGVSLEFFAFPEYFNGVASTLQCLQNLRDVAGTWPPLRIGGTTQDRATYDSLSKNAVTYNVTNLADAPESLTFGPEFMTLAAGYEGKVIIGLNRELDDLNNTIEAATQAVSVMSNLLAIELGNEPNFYSSSSPIANGTWNAQKDRESQLYWQKQISAAIAKDDIISAGVIFGVSSFSIEALAAAEGDDIDTVRDFCSHNYPQGSGNFNLSKLMSHSGIKQQIAQFAPESEAANAAGKEYIFGETNSATQGGGGISPTFGAGLWIVDYVMQSLLLGVKSLYFHQGTIGNCQYCWWGKYDVGSPYYGAYFAAMTLADATQIAPLDDASTDYAGYAIYQGEQLTKVLLYNSEFYNGTGIRANTTFTITGLSSSQVTTKRLRAASATSRQDQGQPPTIAGQYFENGTCKQQGTLDVEHETVSDGVAQFTLAASEALLVYLCED